jgi:hypothetical protein
MLYCVQKAERLDFKGYDGVSRLASSANSLRSSASEPIDCPMHRIKIKPFPPGPTFMIEVMELGAFGAQVCQALRRQHS